MQNSEEFSLTFGMTSDDDNTNVLVEFHRIDGRGQVGNQVFAQRILPNQDKLLVIYRMCNRKIQCCGSGSGIRCLFGPWIRDPD
jgi:hypothetical protein